MISWKAVESLSTDLVSNGVEFASGMVAELVKSFAHDNEILDGVRYKMGATLLIQRHLTSCRWKHD